MTKHIETYLYDIKSKETSFFSAEESSLKSILKNKNIVKVTQPKPDGDYTYNGKTWLAVVKTTKEKQAELQAKYDQLDNSIEAKEVHSALITNTVTNRTRDLQKALKSKKIILDNKYKILKGIKNENNSK